MEVWVLIVASIVGFSLLQLLAYRYLRGSDPSIEQPAPGSGERATVRDRLEQDHSSEDGIHCPHCGTHNDATATYRYCKQCVAPLQ